LPVSGWKPTMHRNSSTVSGSWVLPKGRMKSAGTAQHSSESQQHAGQSLRQGCSVVWWHNSTLMQRGIDLLLGAPASEQHCTGRCHTQQDPSSRWQHQGGGRASSPGTFTWRRHFLMRHSSAARR
jgi:hypothetical protein